MAADRILRTLARAPHGANADDLEAALSGIAKRTLQRRLAELAANGRVEITGNGKARRYHARPQPEAARVAPLATAPEQIALSPAAEQVRAEIRRPIHERAPVGYRARFLEGYRPNRSHYLSAATRAHLLALGTPADPERPAGTYARAVLDRLLIDLSFGSSRLEGNTYTRLDTQNLIELGRQAPGKDARDAQMILNHKAAIEMLVENVDEIGFNRYTICNLHALLAENLLPDPAAGGRVRASEVAISGTVYVPLSIPQQLVQHFDHLLAKASAIEDPFEQAFFAMVHLPYLQPFVDVNKRVSRLAANIPFVVKNLAPLSFIDVPERDYTDGILAIYETQRVEVLRDVFVWAYERSCQRYTVVRDALPQPDPLRLRNRQQLADVVSAIVRDDRPVTDDVIRELAGPRVPASDVDDFIAMATLELHGLHDGNLARYRLRPSELARWSAKHIAPKRRR